MQVHDEIAHMRVVHARLRLGLPGRVGGGVVRVDPDDVQLRKVPEIDGIEAGKLAAKNKVQELLARQVGHGEGVLLPKRNRVA